MIACYRYSVQTNKKYANKLQKHTDDDKRNTFMMMNVSLYYS